MNFSGSRASSFTIPPTVITGIGAAEQVGEGCKTVGRADSVGGHRSRHR